MQANKVNCSRLVSLCIFRAALGRIDSRTTTKDTAASQARARYEARWWSCVLARYNGPRLPLEGNISQGRCSRVLHKSGGSKRDSLVFRYLVQCYRNGLRIRVSVALLVLPRLDGRWDERTVLSVPRGATWIDYRKKFLMLDVALQVRFRDELGLWSHASTDKALGCLARVVGGMVDAAAATRDF